MQLVEIRRLRNLLKTTNRKLVLCGTSTGDAILVTHFTLFSMGTLRCRALVQSDLGSFYNFQQMWHLRANFWSRVSSQKCPSEELSLIHI